MYCLVGKNLAKGSMERTREEYNRYTAVHMWMAYHYGKPQKCDSCGTTEKRMYHWASISGTYRRERDDWLRLCVPCHKSQDIKALGGRIKARPLKIQPSKICPECHIEYFKNPHFSKIQWDSKVACSKACSGKMTGRLLKGTKQSEATKALKSEKLKQRWSDNQVWRNDMTSRMIGNRYAKKN